MPSPYRSVSPVIGIIMAESISHRTPVRHTVVAIAALLGLTFHVGAGSLQLGQAALADDLPMIAERHLAAVLDDDRSSSGEKEQAFLLLLQAISDQGRPHDVLERLAANASIVSNAPQTRIAYWEARSMLELGDATQAVAIATASLPMAEAASTASQTGPEATDSLDDYALLLRIEARAMAGMEGGAKDASKAFGMADKALSRPGFAAMRADNLYEWAHHEFSSGNHGKAKELLSTLASVTSQSTNIPAPTAEMGTLLHATILFGEGQPVQAAVLFDSLATNTMASLPNRAEAVLALATIAADRERSGAIAEEGHPETFKRPAEYLPLIVDFARRLPSDLSWEINQRFGRILLSARSSMPIGAAILTKTIRERPSAPESPANQMAIADAWLSVSSNALAAANYKAYLGAYHEDAGEAIRARFGQARALFRLGDYDEAATLFTRVAERTTAPDLKADCLIQAAQALRSNEKFERAAALFLQAAQMTTTTNGADWTLQAYFNAGDSLQHAGNPIDAELNFKKVVSAPNVSADLANEALYQIALLRDRQADIVGAIEAYSALIDHASENKWKDRALLGRGRNYYMDYKFNQAIGDFDRIGGSVQDIAAEAAYYKLFCLYGTNRDKEAVQNAEDFEKKYPKSNFFPSVVMWLAQYHYNHGDFEKAQQTFTRYANLIPTPSDTPKALLWGATSAYKRTEYQQAIDLLAQLLRLYPDSDFAGEARFLQAKALCTLARFEDAILALNNVINRYPAADFITDAWILYGDALFASASSPSTSDRYEDAQEAYSAARARCKTRKTEHGVIPDEDDFARYIEASFKIGRCLSKKDQLTDARDFLYESVITTYLEAVKNDTFPVQEARTWFARAVLLTADLLEHEGNLDGAIKVLEHLAKSEDIDEHTQAAQIIRHLKADKSMKAD